MITLTASEIQLLEDYWNGQLEAEAMAALEQRMAEDEAFAQAAQEWQTLIEEGQNPPAVERQQMEAIKARLQGYAAEPEIPEVQPGQKRGSKIRPMYLYLAAAASVLILLWLSPLARLWQGSDPYAAYFAHLSRDNANLSLKTEDGSTAYDHQDYRKALPLLLEEVAAGGDSLNLIYAGVAAIGSGQAERAIPILEPLLASQNWQLYHGEIRWYLALAHLQQQEKNKAVGLLQVIAAAQGDYQQQAQQLIDHLGKN